MIRSSRSARAVVAGLALVGLTACGGGHAKTTPTPTPTPTPSTPTPSSSPVSTPVAVAPVDPLTGGTLSRNPVVAVKIDDTAAGRPQVGIDQANIVYIEQVEGGLTRLIAVFHTILPTRVEPVRSVRSNDPELLSQYGPIGFVASGGGGDSLPTLRKSILRPSINDWGGPGFSRDPSRAYVGSGDENLEADLPVIAKAVHAAGAKSIGFTWSNSLAGVAGVQPGLALQTVVGGTGVQFEWDVAAAKYVRYIGGVAQHAADGRLVATPNVIVQYCVGYTNPADVDVNGQPGHFTKSIGHGKVWVYRDGKRILGTWTRTSPTTGTALRDADNHVIPLAVGGAWVVLVTNGAALT